MSSHKSLPSTELTPCFIIRRKCLMFLVVALSLDTMCSVLRECSATDILSAQFDYIIQRYCLKLYAYSPKHLAPFLSQLIVGFIHCKLSKDLSLFRTSRHNLLRFNCTGYSYVAELIMLFVYDLCIMM